ncbi:hypothetical protein D3C87_1685510 [compost metagenome]
MNKIAMCSMNLNNFITRFEGSLCSRFKIQNQRLDFCYAQFMWNNISFMKRNRRGGYGLPAIRTFLYLPSFIPGYFATGFSAGMCQLYTRYTSVFFY